MNEPTHQNRNQSNVYVSDGVPTAIQPNDFPDPDDEPTVTIPYETLQQANERWLGDIAAGIASSERTTRRMKAPRCIHDVPWNACTSCGTGTEVSK